jgi:hypothetical protein
MSAMTTRGSTGRFFEYFLTMSLIGSAGCLGFVHSVPPPPTEQAESALSLFKASRDHVYVMFVNGLDPVNYGNLLGLRDYVTALGFHKTYYGQIYHLWYFEQEIRRVHEADRDARFVLVGFSLGVNVIDAVAKGVKDDGIPIDLLVFLSGNHPVMHMPKDRPENVGRIVNILASGLLKSRGERDWAENVRLKDTRHFDSPTHQETLDTLARELTMLAASVPVVQPEETMPPALEETPTPRPLQLPRAAARKDAWDFLKPVSILHMPKPVEERKDSKDTPPVVPAPERVALR